MLSSLYYSDPHFLYKKNPLSWDLAQVKITALVRVRGSRVMRSGTLLSFLRFVAGSKLDSCSSDSFAFSTASVSIYYVVVRSSWCRFTSRILTSILLVGGHTPLWPLARYEKRCFFCLFFFRARGTRKNKKTNLNPLNRRPHRRSRPLCFGKSHSLGFLIAGSYNL